MKEKNITKTYQHITDSGELIPTQLAVFSTLYGQKFDNSQSYVIPHQNHGFLKKILLNKVY